MRRGTGGISQRSYQSRVAILAVQPASAARGAAPKLPQINERRVPPRARLYSDLY